MGGGQKILTFTQNSPQYLNCRYPQTNSVMVWKHGWMIKTRWCTKNGLWCVWECLCTCVCVCTRVRVRDLPACVWDRSIWNEDGDSQLGINYLSPFLSFPLSLSSSFCLPVQPAASSHSFTACQLINQLVASNYLQPHASSHSLTVYSSPSPSPHHSPSPSDARDPMSP